MTTPERYLFLKALHEPETYLDDVDEFLNHKDPDGVYAVLTRLYRLSRAGTTALPLPRSATSLLGDIWIVEGAHPSTQFPSVLGRLHRLRYLELLQVDDPSKNSQALQELGQIFLHPEQYWPDYYRKYEVKRAVKPFVKDAEVVSQFCSGDLSASQAQTQLGVVDMSEILGSIKHYVEFMQKVEWQRQLPLRIAT